MNMVGTLETFSLAQLLQQIEIESKTGRLIVENLSKVKTSQIKVPLHLWFYQGKFIALTDRINHRGLISTIQSQNLVRERLSKNLEKLCPSRVPLGSYLESMKLLNSQQIELLFENQLERTYQLFEINSGWFKFDEIVDSVNNNSIYKNIPYLEMTGHSIGAIELAVRGLRLLKDWSLFEKRLPEGNSILQKLTYHINLGLIPLEEKLWHLVDGQTSLLSIAQELKEPLKEIIRAAFRLIFAGLLEEVNVASVWADRVLPPPLQSLITEDRYLPVISLPNSQGAKRLDNNNSFFKNLVELLRR
jgi:hypothetical protein